MRNPFVSLAHNNGVHGEEKRPLPLCQMLRAYAKGGGSARLWEDVSRQVLHVFAVQRPTPGPTVRSRAEKDHLP